MEIKRFYKDYFDIDPKYHAAVTKDDIDTGEVSWQDFYPHKSFIKLLENVHKALTERYSVWLEGPYGSGKSYAALVVKSLLEVSDDDVRTYFEHNNLNEDLCQKLIKDKNSRSLVLAYRDGSSGLKTDAQLVLAVQRSIEEALEKAGIENEGEKSLKAAFLKWIKALEANRKYFNDLLKEKKETLKPYFGERSGDEVVKLLEESDNPETVFDIMQGVAVLAEAPDVRMEFKTFDIDGLCKWIADVTQVNNITIVFIWDEFDDFLNQNPYSLTGFQALVHGVRNARCHFLIVSHQSSALIKDDAMRKKIMSRFVGQSTVSIKLPDNISFQIMANAMKERDELKGEWKEHKRSLNDSLREARGLLMEKAKKDVQENEDLAREIAIEDEDLCNIVPLHPYAALVLKHISVAFLQASARSMFDFIKNDDPDIKGFKWFIADRSPFSKNEERILTIDTLWDFITTKSQGSISEDVRVILGSLNRVKDKLTTEQERVFKTVALLEAVSTRSVRLGILRPTPDNLEMAFCGVWDKGKAQEIADDLYSEGTLFKHPGTDEYRVDSSGVNTKALETKKEEVREKLNTKSMIENAGFINEKTNVLGLPARLKERFIIKGCGERSFKTANDELKAKNLPNKIKMLAAFALDKDEEEKIREVLRKASDECAEDFIYVQSLEPMEDELIDKYVDYMASSECSYEDGNPHQGKEFESRANDILKQWYRNVEAGYFRLYTLKHKGSRDMKRDELKNALMGIDHKKYPYGLEHLSLPDSAFDANKLKSSALQGIKLQQTGSFKDLSKVLKGAWNVKDYWKKPDNQGLAIYHIKNKVEELMKNGFNTPGNGSEVSFLSIYEALEEPPFGFMPINVSACILGFVLKEYKSTDFFWTNGDKQEKMSEEKMAEAISRAITQAKNPRGNYKYERIRKMSKELESFLNCSAYIFSLKGEECNSVESVCSVLRTKVRDWSSPLWCVKFALDEGLQLNSPKDKIKHLIDKYCTLLNIDNSESDKESAVAEEIGKVVISANSLQEDLKKIMTPLNDPENCRSGMRAYVNRYRDGELVRLAVDIGDDGEYMNAIRKQFVPESNWAWNQGEVDKKIDNVILDYEIISESNKALRSRYASLSEVLEAWQIYLNKVYMPYSDIDKNVAKGSLKGLLEQFCNIMQDHRIIDKDKRTFYRELCSHGKDFCDFHSNQLSVFKQIYKSELQGLGEKEVAKLIEKLGSGRLADKAPIYYNTLKSKINEVKNESKKALLKQLWKDKTRTEDPVDWSNIHTTPVLCMFEENELNTAEQMMALFFNENPTDKEMEEGLKYFNKAFPWDRLKNPDARNECFMARIVGKYAVLLPNVEKVRSSLIENVGSQVYEWTDNRRVKEQIEKLAKDAYEKYGEEKAQSYIKKMPNEKLRKYMEKLISNNLTVGVEILKEEGSS